MPWCYESANMANPPVTKTRQKVTHFEAALSPLRCNCRWVTSWQTLARDAAAPAAAIAGLTKEHFFGGGMQNGRFAHRGAAIDIGVDYNWEDGGHPNAAPWCARPPAPPFARAQSSTERGRRLRAARCAFFRSSPSPRPRPIPPLRGEGGGCRTPTCLVLRRREG